MPERMRGEEGAMGEGKAMEGQIGTRARPFQVFSGRGMAVSR